MKKTTYVTPSGYQWELYCNMLEQPHLLVAGATGSGKSVLINGLIATALYKSPRKVRFILIDPKRVELVDYKHLPHTLRYASEPSEMLNALQYAMDLIDRRYVRMQSQRVKKWTGSHVYVVIDELADLMTTQGKTVLPIIQRIGQIGRASGVHMIAATQCPKADVIPTRLKVNFDARVGMLTASAQDSRNIIEVKGCEILPDPREEKRAECYYKHGPKLEHYHVPMVPEEEICYLVQWWEAQRPVSGPISRRRQKKALEKLKRTPLNPAPCP